MVICYVSLDLKCFANQVNHSVNDKKQMNRLNTKFNKLSTYHVSNPWAGHFSCPDDGSRNLAHHSLRRENCVAGYYFRFRHRPWVVCLCNHARNRLRFLTSTCKITMEISNVSKSTIYTHNRCTLQVLFDTITDLKTLNIIPFWIIYHYICEK